VVQALVEEEVDLEGELDILHEDRHVDSRFLYVLQTPGGRVALHFAADPPTHLTTGARVRVTGVRVAQTLALSSSTSSVRTLAAALPNTFGAQQTLVILVNFADKATQPYTVAYAQSVVFTTTSNFDSASIMRLPYFYPQGVDKQLSHLLGERRMAAAARAPDGQ
jgi:hypothetical protein